MSERSKRPTPENYAATVAALIELYNAAGTHPGSRDELIRRSTAPGMFKEWQKLMANRDVEDAGFILPEAGWFEEFFGWVEKLHLDTAPARIFKFRCRVTIELEAPSHLDVFEQVRYCLGEIGARILEIETELRDKPSDHVRCSRSG